MKNIKIIGLTIFLFMGIIIPSCDDDHDQCGGIDSSQYAYFDIEGLDLRIYKETLTNELVEPMDSVLFSELGNLYLDYHSSYHATLEPKKNWTFSLINSAIACTPLEQGYNGSKEEEIIEFSITTLNDFDNNHLANDNINDLFDYVGSRYHSLLDNKIPLMQFIDELDGPLEEEDMMLELKKAPELNQEFKVKIKLELSTGEIYEIETEPIFIVD